MWVDLALALGLSAVTLLGVGSNERVAPIALLSTLPLVARRRWPTAVFAVTVLGAALGAPASGSAVLLGVIVSGVSLGLYARRPLVAGGVVLTCATGVAVIFGGTNSLPIPGPLVAYSVLGAAFLAGNEIRRREQRADQLETSRATAIETATRAERDRIARELHDVIAHSVSVMVIQAGAARKVVLERPAAASDALGAVERTGHEAMAELRQLLGVLDDSAPAPLEPQPGLNEIHALVTRVKEAGLPVELRTEGSRPAVPAGVEAAAYRVIQEALTNALRYAGGAKTDVLVRYSPGAIELEVVDEGRMVTPSDGLGRGLAGMRERVARFGGSVEAGKRRGHGYSVRATFPIEVTG